jgi:NTE family protein
MPESDAPTLADALRHKRLGLVLSAGFFGFYGHAGLLLALEQLGLAPAAVSGSSAGALVGAQWASGMSAQQLAEDLGRLRRQDFWDPVGPRDLLRRDLPAAGLLRGERFLQAMRTRLPAREFSDCRVPLLIEVANLSSGESEILQQGELAPAVCASCAFPGLFLPVRLGDQLYWDGGLLNKAPVACLLDHVDVVLIHWLPSDAISRPLALGLGLARHLGTLVRGFAMARRHNSRLQARLAMERGMPVHVLTPDLPRVNPFRMQRGGEVIQRSRQQARSALARPAADTLLDPEARGLL